MTTMDQVHLIRLYYYGQSKSLAEISRIMGLDWRTVRKYVDQEDLTLQAQSRRQKYNSVQSLTRISP